MRITLLALLAALASCGTDPVSPGGAGDDLAGSRPDLAGPGDLLEPSCSPPCAGQTPHCSASRTCVACLVDEHCPVGMICKSFGGTSSCVPGCADDARCAGDGGMSMKCCGGRCVDTAKEALHCG